MFSVIFQRYSIKYWVCWIAHVLRRSWAGCWVRWACLWARSSRWATAPTSTTAHSAKDHAWSVSGISWSNQINLEVNCKSCSLIICRTWFQILKTLHKTIQYFPIWYPFRQYQCSFILILNWSNASCGNQMNPRVLQKEYITSALFRHPWRVNDGGADSCSMGTLQGDKSGR